MGYRNCDDFVKTHYGGFYHLTMPMLDTINSAVGSTFDLKKDRKHEMVTKLLTRIYDLLYNAEAPSQPGVGRDLALYEEWVSTLAAKERFHSYVFFLYQGLNPPISTRTVNVIADVLRVPEIPRLDDWIMETAKVLAFHHFQLRGEIRRTPSPTPDAPAGSAFAYQPGPMAERRGGWLRSASLFRRHAHRGRFPAKDLPVQIPGLEAHRRQAPGGRGIGPKKRAGFQWPAVGPLRSTIDCKCQWASPAPFFLPCPCRDQ